MTTRIPTRSKAEIGRELSEAAAAEKALPGLLQKVEAKDKAAEELARWNSQHSWPQRQETAMAEAKSHIEKAKTAEAHLRRFVGQIAESPAWRAATSMKLINDERIAAQQALADYCRVDFEKSSLAAQESGAADTMIAAKGHVAETASRTRIMDLLANLDEGFDVCRSIPVDQRQIISILRMLLWPATVLQREKPDENRKG